MKKTKLLRVISGITVLTMSLSLFGCNMKDDEEDDEEDGYSREIDSSKTQIYVGNYNGGLGYKWLENAIYDFEEIYNADKTGKDRVELIIDNDKEGYLSSALKNNIKSNRQEMYVLDGLTYYDFANNGLLADITDVVQDSSSGESIEQRMNASLRDYYKIPEDKGFQATGGHYYAIPFYESFYHLIYDKDLFADYGFYLNESGTGFIEPGSSEKRFGEEGSWNYGLPKTYSQFFMMMNKIRKESVIPLTWTGKYRDGYVPRYITTIIANYAGASNFAANYSLTGQVDVVNDYNFSESAANTFKNSDIPTHKENVTTSEWINVLSKQPSLYFGLKFAKDLSKSDYLNVGVIRSEAETHTLAQDTYLRSRPKYETSGKGQPIAMLLEGGYWINEARPSFTDLQKTYGDEFSLQNRNFGIMSFPVADDYSGDYVPTIAATGGSVICVSNTSTHLDVIKKFIKFIHTDKQLRQFTKETYVYRPFDYSLTDAEKSVVPEYVKDMSDLLGKANVVFTLPTYYKLFAKDDCSTPSWIAGSMVSDVTLTNPILDFYGDQNLTVKDYFKGVNAYKSSKYSSYEL